MRAEGGEEEGGASPSCLLAALQERLAQHGGRLMRPRGGCRRGRGVRRVPAAACLSCRSSLCGSDGVCDVLLLLALARRRALLLAGGRRGLVSHGRLRSSGAAWGGGPTAALPCGRQRAVDRSQQQRIGDGVPRPAPLEHAPRHAHVSGLAGAADACAESHLELGGAEWRGKLVLNDLAARLVADDLLAALDLSWRGVGGGAVCR